MVSTKASLQYSMPVQAIVERRNGLGLAVRPSGSTAASSASTLSRATSRTSSFWCGVKRTRCEPAASAASASASEDLAGHPADGRGEADVAQAVLLGVHADVVAGLGRHAGRGTVGERVAEVLGLEDLAELRRAPVGQQELQARLVPQPPVAVVAEDPDDPVPDLAAWSARTKAPRRSARRGATLRPPPTHRS